MAAVPSTAAARVRRAAARVRIWVTPKRRRLAAYLLVLTVFSGGVWRMETLVHELRANAQADCERDNHMRSVLFPVMVRAQYEHLALEFDQPVERGTEAYERFEPTLLRLFPKQPCNRR